MIEDLVETNEFLLHMGENKHEEGDDRNKEEEQEESSEEEDWKQEKGKGVNKEDEDERARKMMMNIMTTRMRPITRRVRQTTGSNDHAGINTLEKLTLTSRLRDLLKGSMYQERHITILTENTNEKTLIQGILRCTKYPIQDATSFPVKNIVVNTLENFEGLESPVILFIVPESWGTSYVGSLKYRVCIATRAISRLEFLVPWDPAGRETDLIDLRRAFQREVSSKG